MHFVGTVGSRFNTVLHNIDELVQERHNSIANALELCLSCTNPSIYDLANVEHKPEFELTIDSPQFTHKVSILLKIVL